MQRRLVAAVWAPAGIAHLEDPGVLDRLASARGELLGGQPAGAPMALVSLLGDRLTGVLACAGRWPRSAGGSGSGCWSLAAGPPAAWAPASARRPRACAAPASRCGAAGTCSGSPGGRRRPRRCGLRARRTGWRSAIARSGWGRCARAGASYGELTHRVWLSGLLVLAAYAPAAGTLGYAADHQRDLAANAGHDAADAPGEHGGGLDHVRRHRAGADALRAARPRRADRGRWPPSADAAGAPAARAAERARALRARVLRLPRAPRSRRSPGSTWSCGWGSRSGSSASTARARRRSSRCWRGMRAPTGGRITVDGTPLGELDARDWQRQVAVVYQDFARLPLTAAENVGLVARARPRSRCRRPRSGPGVAELIAGLPHGLGHGALAALRRRGRPQRRAVAADRAGPRAVRGGGRRARAGARRADRPARRARRGGVLRPLPGADRGRDEHRHLAPLRQRAPRGPDRRAATAGGSPSWARTRSCSRSAGAYAEMFRVQAERFAA